MSNSTPEKQNAIAERLELAAKIIREDLEFEIYDKQADWPAWTESGYMPHTFLDIDKWELRVKPTPAPPKLVPLTAADIPPGSAYRHSGWAAHNWVLITGASDGILDVGRGTVDLESAFTDKRMWLKRPGETVWGPFSKPEEPTTTPE